MALQVGVEVLKGGVGFLLGSMAIKKGWDSVSGLQALRDADAVDLVEKVALDGLAAVGLSAGTLSWAHFSGWVELGGWAAVSSYVGLGSFLVSTSVKLWHQIEKFVEVYESNGVRWKVVIEGLRVASHVCQLAFSILAIVSIATGAPSLALAGVIVLFLGGGFGGAAWQLENEGAQRGWNSAGASSR